ncbi:adenylate kinase [Streptomyces inhibens]|uniref:Adenylate kinase n=1 Tax=Streptomyces inhibens TaxID=2293571 RepID=A0A371QBM7_STRIH|nr:adenylate kinase [Streptomyces inhibens]
MRTKADAELIKVREHAAELLYAADEALRRSQTTSGEASPAARLGRCATLRVVLVGPPGAGKGVQAAFLAKYLGVPHASLGDMLRSNIVQGTRLGRTAKKLIEKGQLIPDEVVLAMTEDRLRQHDAQRGFLLDGAPRNVGQAVAMDEFITLDAVLDVEIPEEETFQRLTGRRVCRHDSSHVFHVVYNPAKSYDTCDLCCGMLYLREDDSEGVIRSRLDVYYSDTRPIIDHYRASGLVTTIHGLGKVHEVTERAMEALAGAIA